MHTPPTGGGLGFRARNVWPGRNVELEGGTFWPQGRTDLAAALLAFVQRHRQGREKPGEHLRSDDEGGEAARSCR